MNSRVHVGDSLAVFFAFEAAAKGASDLVERAARVQINQFASQPLGLDQRLPRLGGEQGGKLHGLRHQLGLRVDVIHQAYAVGFGGRNVLAGHCQFFRARKTDSFIERVDDLRQADVNLCLSEDGFFGGESYVAEGCKVESSRDAGSINRSDDRLRQFPDQTEDARDGVEIGELFLCRPTDEQTKIEPDEKPEDCALREVREETGLRCELGRPLGCTAYVDRRGRDKVVCYWMMEVKGGRFRPGIEVDRLLWLNVEDALERLTYGRDKTLLRQHDLD